MLFVLKIEKCF